MEGLISPFKYIDKYEADLDDLMSGVARLYSGASNIPSEISSSNGCFAITFAWDINTKFQFFVSFWPSCLYFRLRDPSYKWGEWSKLHGPF